MQQWLRVTLHFYIFTISANFRSPQLSQITLIKIGYPQTSSNSIRDPQTSRNTQTFSSYLCNIFCLCCQFLLISFTFSLLPFSFCYLCHLLDPLKCHILTFQKFCFLIYILYTELTTNYYINKYLIFLYCCFSWIGYFFHLCYHCIPFISAISSIKKESVLFCFFYLMIGDWDDSYVTVKLMLLVLRWHWDYCEMTVTQMRSDWLRS